MGATVLVQKRVFAVVNLDTARVIKNVGQGFALAYGICRCFDAIDLFPGRTNLKRKGHRSSLLTAQVL